jgi:hypothetical protein
MEVFMKTKVLLKAAIAGVVLLLALSFVTCELDLLGLNKGNDEDNLDWEYVENANGDMELTVWLDGSKPYKSSTQTRALNLGIAKRSHDYFEAIFVDATSSTVARAAWEIGQPAGIRGVPRGKNYGDISESIICVGKKESGSEGRATLLGVGWLSHIDGVAFSSPGTGDVIAGDTRNVTFTVSALKTEVGYVDFDIMTLHETFVTATISPSNDPDDADASNTSAGTATFKGGATFTIFGLPPWDKADLSTYYDVDIPDPEDPGNDKTVKGFQIAAIYTIGGFTDGVPAYAAPLSDSLYHWPCADDNFQLQERVGLYMAMGQTYDVPEALDTVTTVQLHGDYAADDDDPFNPIIPLLFTITAESGGVFSFTFQTPVYALTKDPSTNGGPNAATWYIRPAYGQQQYLLDNGRNVGGAVLMGVGVGGLDWLDIIVEGFGFTNTPIVD